MSAMDFGLPVFQRGRALLKASSYNFDPHSNGFSYTKPTGVVDVHSMDQWRAYFEASKQNKQLLVIEFTAQWCRPCRLLEPTMEEFAAQYTDVVFIKIDVDELKLVARQFNVATLPAIELVKKGKLVDGVEGVKKNELQSKIENHRI